VDLLSNESIATTITKLLLERPDKPVTIGVHGDWGAGKSSVLEMIEAGLATQENVICLKFNGWRYQGFEDAKIALLEGIVTELLEKRPALTKAADKVKDIFHRIDWLKVAKHAGSLAITAFAGNSTPIELQTALVTLGTILYNPASPPTKSDVDAAVEKVFSYVKPDTPSRNVPEEIGQFRKAFDNLLEEAKVNRLIVLIDDLDRCLPDTAIETLEAIRLFVFTPKTAFVVAADETMIEYAVRKHFPDAPYTSVQQGYARNYLEKLIQVPFRIPPLGVTETRIYVTLLLVGNTLGEDDPDFVKLISASRERLKRPWAGETVDTTLIKTNLGAKADQVTSALMLSDQIGPILANGTKGNPRQIKRFLNTLMLRKLAADARGFGDDIKLPVLAKLMLAERFNPTLFERIVNEVVSSPDGVFQSLRDMETENSSDGKTGAARKYTRKTTDQGDSMASKVDADKKSKVSQLDEALGPWVTEWIKIKPDFSDIDLRPYLFVTKDRKDYFGATTVLGHLATVAEQLMEAKILVQSREEDLRRLTEMEASQVFDMVRTQILSTGTFETQPNGVDGLVVLVRAQPALQTNLIDFLEGLPNEQLGAWAVQGWEKVIVDSAQVERFKNLLAAWSQVKNNPMLKTAAAGVMQTPRRRR
jgi:predicted KAP-like P-loop ATPase